jgi:hypothetical protein
MCGSNQGSAEEVQVNKTYFRVTFAIILCVGLFASQAMAVERKVDCSIGQSLQKALDTAPAASGDIFYIQFDGVCEEVVTIRRDNVRIDGGGTGTIVGTINVLGSQGVWLERMTVTGPGPGVVVSQASAVLNHATVTGNEFDGILVRRNASVWARFSTVSGNGHSGAYVDSSTIDAFNSTFEGNTVDGILAVSGSKVVLFRTRMIANQGAGVALTLHSILDIRAGSRFADNAGYGVLARLDSGVWISQPGVDFSDSIQCEDYESSFHTDHEWPSGPVYCSPF